MADKYHNLNLTRKMSLGQTQYHRSNTMVLIGDSASMLDKLEMAATAEQRQVDHLMETIHQQTKENKILRDQMKQRVKKNTIFTRQGQEENKTAKKSYLTKLDPTRNVWTQLDNR